MINSFPKIKIKIKINPSTQNKQNFIHDYLIINTNINNDKKLSVFVF